MWLREHDIYSKWSCVAATVVCAPFNCLNLWIWCRLSLSARAHPPKTNETKWHFTVLCIKIVLSCLPCRIVYTLSVHFGKTYGDGIKCARAHRQLSPHYRNILINNATTYILVCNCMTKEPAGTDLQTTNESIAMYRCKTVNQMTK